MTVPGDEVPADFRQAVPVPLVPPARLLVRGDNDIDTRLLIGRVIKAPAR